MSVGLNPINDVVGNYTASKTYSSKTAAKTEESAKVSEGAVYEGSTDNTKASYSINKMSAEDRANIVAQLKQDMEARQNQLSSIVQEMLGKQAGASNLASLFTADKLKNVSAADIAQAKQDVSEDGYYGVKQTSQRLFDFACALAGDDVEKMKEMQAAMEKGFKLATKAWGTDLPDICQNTIDAANKLFEDYYTSKSA